MKHTRLLQFLIIFSLLLTMGSSPPQQVYAANAQPLLVEMATQDPNQLVRVIVQKTSASQDVEMHITSLGGKVTSNLHIINAFVAEMTAEAAVKLSQAESVRWVSLDASIQKSGLTDNTLADFFGSVAYNNNNGTMPWLNSWVETGETTSPSAGSIKVASGQLSLSNSKRTISRSANLSQATSATLTFTYKRSNFTSSSNKVVVQVSGDGGSTWTTLSTMVGPGSDASPLPASFDLTPFLSANTTIRFGITAGTSNYLYWTYARTIRTDGERSCWRR